MTDDVIRIRGARQNNLRGLDLDLPLHELIVVTGVSGSGKSSLAFDTVYSEGQRRYVETFSPYARQFLDRMDRPQVDRIEGIPPSIAIDQTNPVRTSRSTVGTMTELNDHLKLLYSRAAHLYCRSCASPVRRDNAQSIFADLVERAASLGGERPRVAVTFPVPVPHNFSEQEVLSLLEKQGYMRVFGRSQAAAKPAQGRRRKGKATEATAAAVVLATRGALDTHRFTIEVMHGIGATDRQIAALFQRRIAIDSLTGSLVGAALAGAVLLVEVDAGRGVGGLQLPLHGPPLVRVFQSLLQHRNRLVGPPRQPQRVPEVVEGVRVGQPALARERVHGLLQDRHGLVVAPLLDQREALVQQRPADIP